MARPYIPVLRAADYQKDADQKIPIRVFLPIRGSHTPLSPQPHPSPSIKEVQPLLIETQRH